MFGEKEIDASMFRMKNFEFNIVDEARKYYSNHSVQFFVHDEIKSTFEQFISIQSNQFHIVEEGKFMHNLVQTNLLVFLSEYHVVTVVYTYQVKTSPNTIEVGPTKSINPEELAEELIVQFEPFNILVRFFIVLHNLAHGPSCVTEMLALLFILYFRKVS